MKRFNLIRNFLILSICFMFVGLLNVNAEELSGNITSSKTITENIILSGDVTLSNNAFLIVGNGANVTIDLNGYKLEQTKNKYAIDNSKGTLTIVDNGSTKGKIVCNSKYTACIRNYKLTKIDGVIIDSNYTAIKNEEATTLIIKNSNITSKRDGTILNYGTATIDDSVITNTSTKSVSEANNGIAIYALTYSNYSSHAILKNCVLDANSAVITSRDGAADPSNPVAKVEIIDSEIINNANIFLINNFSDVSFSGNIKAPISIIQYAKSGTNFILNKDVNQGVYSIPNGVILNTTLVNISDDAEISVNDIANIDINEDKVIVYNSDNDTYSILNKADYSKLNQVLEKTNSINKKLYTQGSYKKLMDSISNIDYNLDEGKQNIVDEYVTRINHAINNLVKIPSDIKNPNTFDISLKFIILFSISLFIVIIIARYFKKMLN